MDPLEKGKMILDQELPAKSLLFAKFAEAAYSDNLVRFAGYDATFYERAGAQAYKFEDATDIVIACRGTEPAEFNDIKADLRAIPVLAETVGRVHKGFKSEVDELWPMIKEDLEKCDKVKKLWFCGHSLGAAMATIVASRCQLDPSMHNIEALYTYGSPRVGWNKYCKSLGIRHFRWRNNNDIVTTVPPALMGFKHHGTLMYMNAYGQVRNLTGWQRAKDKFRGMWMGLKKGRIDNFSDHSITEYVKNLEGWVNE